MWIWRWNNRIALQFERRLWRQRDVVTGVSHVTLPVSSLTAVWPEACSVPLDSVGLVVGHSKCSFVLEKLFCLLGLEEGSNTL